MNNLQLWNKENQKHSTIAEWNFQKHIFRPYFCQYFSRLSSQFLCNANYLLYEYEWMSEKKTKQKEKRRKNVRDVQLIPFFRHLK